MRLLTHRHLLRLRLQCMYVFIKMHLPSKNIHFIFHSPLTHSLTRCHDGRQSHTDLFLQPNLLSLYEKEPRRWLVTSSKHHVWAKCDKENQQPGINLRARLQDYFHLKPVKINVYIYLLCEALSIIQDSALFPRQSCQKSCVNIYSVLNPGESGNDCVFFSEVTLVTFNLKLMLFEITKLLLVLQTE